MGEEGELEIRKLHVQTRAYGLVDPLKWGYSATNGTKISVGRVSMLLRSDCCIDQTLCRNNQTNNLFILGSRFFGHLLTEWSSRRSISTPPFNANNSERLEEET